MSEPDVNHPINIASRRLQRSIEMQNLKGGPNYQYWEDDLEFAISRLALAIVDEVTYRITGVKNPREEAM